MPLWLSVGLVKEITPSTKLPKKSGSWHISGCVSVWHYTTITMVFVAHSHELVSKKCKEIQEGIKWVSAVHAIGVHHPCNTSNTVQFMD